MSKTQEKVVKVALKDLDKVCRVCGLVGDTVQMREYRSSSYMGPCGDSFCYASCDMDTCRPVRTRACERCEKAKRAPGDQ